MYFVIGRDGVIYYPVRGLSLLSIDRFSLLRSSFTHFGLEVDSYWYKQLIFSRWSRSGLVPDDFCTGSV